MISHLIGNVHSLYWVALKALLLYITAIFGFRLGERRTLAEMSAFDFVAAVAVGAIVGRVPNSDTTSYLEGAVTLITVLAAHRAISMLRRSPTLSRVFDHSPRVLVQRGQIIESQLRRSGLTKSDLFGILRQHGVTRLGDVQLVIFEQRGKISLIRQTDVSGEEPDLLHNIVNGA